jgi:hypothetical protein
MDDFPHIKSHLLVLKETHSDPFRLLSILTEIKKQLELTMSFTIGYMGLIIGSTRESSIHSHRLNSISMQYGKKAIDHHNQRSDHFALTFFVSLYGILTYVFNLSYSSRIFKKTFSVIERIEALYLKTP